MTDNSTTLQAEIESLEDACLGLALIIDNNQPEDSDVEPGGPNDPFFNIIMEVMQARMNTESLESHRDSLSETWDSIRNALGLPGDVFETAAQRGSDLGDQLRSPPEESSEEGDLVPLAETDAGRTIWGVNADGWDEEVFEQEGVTLGMKPDGTVEPVPLGKTEDENGKDGSS